MAPRVRSYTDVIDRINKETYYMPESVGFYDVKKFQLKPPERLLFDKVAEEAKGKPILDIGVGPGRSVPALLDISRDYTAIDYSPQMVEFCQKRFPGVKFLFADARDLTQFADESFFLVVFTCNGIDMVQHEDRFLILKEAHRVLQKGGYYIFSTHNQACPDHTAGFQWPEFVPTVNPLRMVSRSLRFAKMTAARAVNYYRFSKLNVRNPDHSMINDIAHDYRMMAYYVSLPEQMRQLKLVGFDPKNVEVYDLDGKKIEKGTDHSSMHFLVKKS